MARLETFTQRVETLCHSTGDKVLQEWRTNGQIAYISLGGKVLYKEFEIQKMLV